ncbi:iron-containing alcohol dehydrogenase family protein [Natronorarus salvus]|uniref:iron-containing alcohol dehydrogenase family protein n=1 Tax=Natronorarus salvus TaxID=3117733 RepID=UPI002F2661EB
MSFDVQLPAQIVFGRGAATNAGNHADSFGTRALVLTEYSLVQLGVVDPVTTSLRDAGLEVDVFDGVKPDPTLSIVNAAVAAARESGADVLVGVGGGSSMDVTKAVGILLENPELESEPFGRGHVPKPGMPTILLPTTAGSGAEVSPAVVVVDDRNGHEKKGIIDPNVFANVAIVDPSLSDDLPPSITRSTGIDAFAHAVGSAISTSSNPFADALCSEAMALVEANLREATFNGADAPTARDGMALAAMMAMAGRVNGGKAAIHAMAYGVQSLYDIPHGVAIAAVMPSVLEYNLPAAVSTYAALGSRLYGASGDRRTQAATFLEGVHRLRSDVGLDDGLREYGATAADLDDLASMAVTSTRHLETNPRSISESDARIILETAL